MSTVDIIPKALDSVNNDNMGRIFSLVRGTSFVK